MQDLPNSLRKYFGIFTRNNEYAVFDLFKDSVFVFYPVNVLRIVIILFDRVLLI